ncbi:MAG: urease subunit beta [Alistipes sp.]|nr:urease subunit beta [Alistipes sp.]
MEKRDKTQTLYPNQKGFTPEKQPKVGGTVLGKDSIEYNVGRESITLTIRNTGDRPIQVGSHYHLFEVNRFLDFDREAAFGMHLNIPSTTAIRFEPGDSKQVEAVAYGGKRRVIGFNSLVEGYAGEEDAPTYYPTRERAIRRMQRLGFKHTKSKQSNKQNKE